MKMREHDRLRGLLRYTNDENLVSKFKETRNLARQLINKARSKYVLEGLQEDQLTPKRYWRRLKQLMPGKKDASKMHQKLSILDKYGNTFESEEQMATYINDYFVNVGANLASLITQDNTSYLHELPNLINSAQWYYRRFSPCIRI